MAAPLYSRYIPPKSKKNQSNDYSTPSTSSSQNVAPPAEVLISDTSKKRKRTPVEASEAKGAKSALAPTHDELLTKQPELDERQKTDAEAVKKVKKPKRSKLQNLDGGGLDDEARLQKHSSVLAKFQKSSRIADASRQDEIKNPQRYEASDHLPNAVAKGLVPIPQPLPDAEPVFKPTFSALPSWLAEPIVVKSDFVRPFEGLNISAKVLDNIRRRGLKESFAVQSALLPLLLHGPDSYKGDILVSAATGSGKTLAYLLPLVERLRQKLVTKLRALVIVPTRELVAQAKEAVDFYASGTGVHSGVAVGNVSLVTEQSALVERFQNYDPEGAKSLLERASQMLSGEVLEDREVLQDVEDTLPGHVLAFQSRVDLLICTPGRLVEHLQSTRGFSLDHLEWLIIDEADRLLDESYSEWVPTLMAAIEARRKSERQVLLAKSWLPPAPDRVLKVVLSATMTRDLNKLAALKLYRPTLVAISDYAGNIIESENVHHERNGIMTLPSLLEELAVPVGDGSEKPLYLLRLLDGIISSETHHPKANVSKVSRSAPHESSSSISSSSTSDSIETDISDYDGTAISESSDETSPSESSDSVTSMSDVPENKITKGSNGSNGVSSRQSHEGVLVFTGNNEDATRIGHLLSTLDSRYQKTIGVLTKSSATSDSRKIIRNFRNGRLKLLIASDRASRGLDMPEVRHVINYDMPHALPTYIHRVGRTARAGSSGTAWTFFTDTEGRWFWNEVARSPQVQRGNRKVERHKINLRSLDSSNKTLYRDALKDLQGAVQASVNGADR